MNRPMQRLVLAGLVAGVAACSTPAATERFYALTDGGAGPAAAGGASTTPPLTVVFTAITVPQLVDRPQIVTLDGANRVAVSEQNQWAEPLTAAIGRALATRLSRSFAASGRSARVASYPQNSIAAPDVRVTVDVQRFEGVLGGPARVDALWTVRRASGGSPLSGRTSAVRETNDASYDAVVRAWSEALAPLERDIAAAIETTAR